MHYCNSASGLPLHLGVGVIVLTILKTGGLHLLLLEGSVAQG